MLKETHPIVMPDLFSRYWEKFGICLYENWGGRITLKKKVNDSFKYISPKISYRTLVNYMEIGIARDTDYLSKKLYRYKWKDFPPSVKIGTKL